MKPFLTCPSAPQRLHRNAIRSLHRQPHRRWIWAIYAALKPSFELTQGDGYMTTGDDNLVKRLAHLLWMQEGSPEGNADANWQRAREIISTLQLDKDARSE